MGFLADLLGPVGVVVVDDGVCAKGEEELVVLLGAGGDHVCAGEFAELDCVLSYTAGAAVDEEGEGGYAAEVEVV